MESSPCQAALVLQAEGLLLTQFRAWGWSRVQSSTQNASPCGVGMPATPRVPSCWVLTVSPKLLPLAHLREDPSSWGKAHRDR